MTIQKLSIPNHNSDPACSILSKDLLSVARFWHWDRDSSQWSMLTAAQYHATGKPQLPRYGTVEVFAQSLRLSWPETFEHPVRPFVAVNTHTFAVRPCFLAHTTSSNLYAGMSRSCPPMDIDELLKLCQSSPSLRFIFLHIGSDLVASAMRMKFEVARRANAHNANRCALDGVLVFIDGQCVAHIIHREIESAFALKLLVPNLYATCFCCSLTDTYALVVKELEAVVRADLQTGFHPRLCPPNQALF